MYVSGLNNYSAGYDSRANLYQGTAAIASWLSSLTSPQVTSAGAPPPPSQINTAILVGSVQSPYSLFRAQVTAGSVTNSEQAATGSSSFDGQGASDYQQALAAYTDSGDGSDS